MAEIQVVGMDGFAPSLTGSVAKTITAAASDAMHIPLVILKCEEDDDEDREEILGWGSGMQYSVCKECGRTTENA